MKQTLSTRMITFLILLVISFTEAQVLTEDCKENYQKNNFLGCIDLPFSQVPETQNENCWSQCDKTEQKTCCVLECQLSVTGVYVDGKFSRDNYINGYEVYYSWADMEEDDKQKWRPVVEKSYETCEILMHASTDVTLCNVPPYLNALLDCMNYMNFDNAPPSMFNPIIRCTKVKNYAETQRTCGRVLNDVWVLDRYFWNPSLYEDAQAVTRLPAVLADCRELYRYNNIRGCTWLPYATLSVKQNDACWRKCKSEKCCYLECQLSTTGMYFEGEFNKDAYIQGFDVYFEDWYPEGAKIWRPSVEKSYAQCEVLMPYATDISPCQTPSYLFTLFDCMDTFNFINAPVSMISQNLRCTTAQHFAATQKICGRKLNYTYVLDYFFWNPEQIYDDQKSLTTAMFKLA